MGYTLAIKTARMQVVANALDAAASAGTLKLGTAGMAEVLAVIPLQDPAASVAGGVLTLLGTPIVTTGLANGVPVEAALYDGDDSIVRSGLTVGLSGADIITDNSAIYSGEDVTLLAGTISHA